ncbi:MAG: caspase family protein [Spirochaetales bacterium]|nr:caspase family protein [Spirochaetales bacterium]
MKRKRFIINLIFILIIAMHVFPEEDRGIGILNEEFTNHPVIGRQYLLIIGINNYLYWTPLQHPVKDAMELRDILVSRYYIDEVIELYDEKATKAAILKTFEYLQQQLKANDSLLIFYAGHGYLDSKTDSGFWIPVDAGTDAYSQVNWLNNTLLRGSISKMESRHIFIIADSCFSGGILDIKRVNQELVIDIEYFKKAYTRISRQVLTSGAREKVPDKSEFFYQLKMALKSNRSKFVDPLMLYTEIRLGVIKTNPLFGVLADTGHQAEASFLLFLRPDSGEPVFNSGPESMEPAQEPEAVFKTKPFLVSFSGALSTSVGETFTTVNPFGGCELTGEWRIIVLNSIYFSLILDQWYIFHPKRNDAKYLNNLHILYSGLGLGTGLNLGFFLPLTLELNLLGGIATGIIDNKMYITPVLLVNPGIAAQAGMTFNVSKILFLRAKAQYLAVVNSRSYMNWYHEVSVGGGIGIRF